MKRRSLFTVIASVLCVICLALCFVGCGESRYVTGIVQGESINGITEYTVTYSDGTTSSFTMQSGKDGKDGANGKDGENGKDVSIEDIYNKFIEVSGENLSYAEFLEKYLTLTTDNTTAIAQCLNSVLKVYSEFIETASSGWFSQTDTMIYTGSAVIYEMNESDGYAYMITNYHVLYDRKANASANGGYTARKIHAYLYGSEGSPESGGTRGEDGYTVYDYGEYAIECEYLGGSAECDIAVIKAPIEKLTSINPNACAVEIADYKPSVGQTAIAIGNPEDAGISVTEGIISVDGDYITLSLDGTKRYYRSIRIDTALYGGNSGGGLFDRNGKLIGITNAGSTSDENINYAIPLPIALGAADNIIYRYSHPLDTENYKAGVYKISLGITVTTSGSKYVYDKASESGKIVETVSVVSVAENSIAEKTGIKADDIITGVSVNGVAYAVARDFDISDILLTVREGDTIQVLTLGGETTPYLVLPSDLKKLS